MRGEHEWSQRDYTEYEQRVRRLVYSARGKEALRRGGIVAYIASQYINGLAAVQGPVRNYESQPEKLTLGGEDYFTDNLTAADLEVLTGTFYTEAWDDRDTTPKFAVSYWPPADMWKKSMFGRGCWTTECQTFVEHREKELRHKTIPPVPLSKTGWASRLPKYRTRKGRDLLGAIARHTHDALGGISRREDRMMED
jgi:hypothetical protein